MRLFKLKFLQLIHMKHYVEEKNLKFLLAIMIVLEFPPRLSFNNQVKTESL